MNTGTKTWNRPTRRNVPGVLPQLACPAGRVRTVLPPVPPRPLSPRDREYFRSLREAEMQAWNAIQLATPAIEGTKRNPSLMGTFYEVAARERKWDLVLLGLLTVTAAIAVASGLASSSQFVQRWADFVGLVQGLVH